jgi:hypothetical protein
MYSTFDAFLIIAIAGVAVSVILFIIKKLKKRGLLIEEEAETKKSFASQDDYLQQMTTQHGEPDDVITISSVLTPTKSMPILVYSDFLIVDGLRVNNDEIKDVTFNNSAVPYVANDYQIIINTTLHGYEFIHISVGNDIEMAQQVTEQLRAALSRQSV